MQPPDSNIESNNFAADPFFNNPDENNLWHSTFNAVEDAICIIDNQHRIVRCNKAMQKLTGNNNGTLIGKHCFEVVHGTEHLLAECPINKMQQSLKRESVELKLGDQWFIVTVDPLYGTNKELIGAVHIARNITKRKQTEEKLKESELDIRKKLEMVLSPESNIGELELADIIDAPALQAVMDDFYAITKIGIGIIDLKGKVLVANGWQDICTRFHRTHPDTCRNCIESDTILSLPESDGIGKFKAYKCKNNMWDLSTPVIIGGKHLGNIFLGQFFYDDENPDYEVFRSLARKYGFNEDEYISALKRVPRWNHETVKNVMSFHSRLALLISNMSYTNLKLAQTFQERNKANEELRSNYTLLRMAGETSKFGGWSVELAKNKTSWSDMVAAIHEEPAGYSPSLEQGINYYAPEWRNRISKVFSDCATKGIQYDEEMEILTAKSKRIWVRTTGEAVRDENGKIVKVQGSFQNIDRQKKIENALKKSEELLNLFMKYSPVYTFIKEVSPSQSKVILASENYKDMVGISGSQMKGKDMSELFPEEFAAKIIADDWNVVSENEVFIQDEELNGKSYTTIKFPIGADGKNLLAGFTIDITERKMAEEALRQSEIKYRRLHESMMDGFVFTDMNGYITECNETYRQMLGYSNDEISKLTYQELTPERWRPIENVIVTEQILPRGYSDVYQKEYIRKDGTIFPIELRAFLVKNNRGENEGIWAIVRDITKRKKAEQALVENEARLKELNATKDKFFSIIAHDLKNPFNSIIGFSELLTHQIEEKDYDGIEKYAGIIRNSSQRAMDLLQNLLDWSRVQTGRMVFSPEIVDVIVLVNEAIDLLNDSASQKSIIISRSIPNNLLVSVDGFMFSTIVRNLVSNAIKFSYPGGEIRIRIQELNNQIEILVSDNGIGIKADQLENLFCIDKSQSKPGTQNEVGTGLGLILCKEFVEMHGGKIVVESQPAKGTTFRILLPNRNY